MKIDSTLVQLERSVLGPTKEKMKPPLPTPRGGDNPPRVKMNGDITSAVRFIPSTNRRTVRRLPRRDGLEIELRPLSSGVLPLLTADVALNRGLRASVMTADRVGPPMPDSRRAFRIFASTIMQTRLRTRQGPG
jgi:hypothetical protein